MSFQSDKPPAEIVRILKKPSGQTTPQTAGTGFFVFNKSSKLLIITCVHVINFTGAKPGETVEIALASDGQQLTARVEEEFWHEPNEEDVAILSLQESLLDKDKITPLKLGTSVNIQEHSFKSYGFPKNYSVKGVWSRGSILGQSGNSPLIQLSSKEIAEGFSGAPVLDEQTRRVVGMVTGRINPVSIEEKTKDKLWQFIPVTMPEIAFATPSEVLQRICPDLILDNICPYVGLEAFTQEKAEFFYGRENCINELKENLRKSSNFLAVVGSSGSGKSSVVQAGLLPQLSKIVGFNKHELFILRPGNEPNQTLQSELNKKGIFVTEDNPWKAILDTQKQRNCRIVLLVDQFEELFALCEKPEQSKFLDGLSQILNSNPQISLIITIRADFYDPLLRSPLGTYLNGGQVNLRGMEDKELEAAIQEPADKVGLDIDSALIYVIIQDLKYTENPLPLLQFTLTQLWEQENSQRRLTLECYRETGRVTSAISQWADRTYNELTKEEQNISERIFTRLVYHGGEDTPNTRRRLPFSELQSCDEQNDNIHQVSKKWADARLLVTDEKFDTEKEKTVEIIHDALLVEWQKLKSWIKNKSDFLLWRQRLQTRLNESKPKDYDEVNLLRGVALEEAVKWQRQYSADLNNVEREFIAQSREMWDKEREEQERVQLDQIKAISRYSNVLWKQENYFDALLEILGAIAPSLKLIRAIKDRNPSVYIQIEAVLLQAIYRVRERNRLQVNGAWVNCVSFSPNGKLIASANADNTVKLWSVDGKELNTLQGANSVSFSPDGKLIASASPDDYTVKLWSIDGALLKTLNGHTKEVHSVNFNSNGEKIASGSEDGTVKLWNTDDGKEVNTLRGHKGSVNCVNFSPNGEMIASGSKDCTVKLWNIDNGKEVNTLQGHNLWVNCLSFSPKEKIIASGSEDGTVKLWNIDNGKEVNTLNNESQVHCISFSPDGKVIACGSSDHTITLFSSEQVSILQGHNNTVYSISFSPDGKIIASGSADHSVKLWCTEDKKLTKKVIMMQGHRNPIRSVSFSPDGKLIASSGDDSTVILWSIDGKKLNTLRGHERNVTSVNFSPDGKIIASGSDDHTVKLWKSIDGKEQITLRGHRDIVTSVSFSTNSKLIASASADHTVKLWNIDGQEVNTLQAHTKGVSDVKFSPNGKLIAFSCEDIVKLYTIDGQEVNTLSGHRSSIWHLSFSKDGKLIASASEDRTVKLWSVDDGTLQKSFEGHSDWVRGVSFSPNDKIVASASGDGSVKLWRVDDGTLLKSLQGHIYWVWSVSFSPDGKFIASGGSDRTVILWNWQELNLDYLLVQGCDWMRDYLKNNPNVRDSERYLYNDIAPASNNETGMYATYTNSL